MRKDVKLGFAVGGVLLAVLVVYVLVISGGDNPPAGDKNKSVALVTPNQSNTTAKPAETPAAPAATEQPNGRRTGRNRPAPGGGAAPAAEQPAAPRTETATPQPQPDSVTVAGDPFKSLPTTVPEIAFATGAAGPASAPSADDRWTTLHTGLPVLMTSTPSAPTPAAPVPSVAADANLPTQQPAAENSSSTVNPILASAASNTPAAVGGAEVPIRVSTPQTPAPEAQLPTTVVPVKTVAADQHVVQPGETFSSIAAAAYGNAAFYPHILRANPNIDAKKLRPGMTINLPPASQVKGEAAAAATPAIAPAAQKLDEKTEYRVETGDNLNRISAKLYGSIKNVDKLYDLNKTAIGPDKAKLKVGTVLKLPEAPTVKP